MVEGGILTAIAIIFAIMSTYLPFIGPFINFIWPVPIIILGVRQGYKWSIMATFASGVIIALLLHPLKAVAVVVGFALIGIVIGYGFRKGYSPVKTFLLGSAASFVSKVAVLGLAALVTGINPIEFQTSAMTKAFEESIEIYRQMGMNEQRLKEMADTIPPLMDLVKTIFPAVIVILAAFDTYLNFQLSRIILNKQGYNLQPFPLVKNWNVPKGTIYFLVVGLLMIYWGKSREIDILYIVGVNIQIIATILLIVQGVAITYYLSDKYNLSRLKIGAILMLLVMSGFLMQILLFVGAFDLIFDYRRLKRR